MQSVLITGAGGFVGSHLATRLLEQGQAVVGVVRDWKPNSLDALGLVDRIVVARADVRDAEALERIISQYEVDTVYHLAAVSTVAEAQRNPIDAYDVNVMGTVRLLDVCRRKNVKRVVVSASDKVYGPAPVPYHESMPLLGREVYPASKVCQDVVTRSFAYTYDLPVAVMRSVNIYGPGDLDESRLIPGNLMRLLRGQPAKLYSHAIGMVRQFVYVGDAVDAFLTVAAHLQDVPGTAYNIGGFEPGGVDVSSVLKGLVKRVSGQMETIESALREIPRQFLNDSALRQLGWQPRVSMEQGLDLTVQWYKDWLNNNVYAG